jgi:ribonuclease P protein component|tara:strand:- start:98 stop:463 length:366 start_codon:yes stop_codon:yes gene_type:complete
VRAENGFSASYRLLKSTDFQKLSFRGKTLKTPAFKIQILANKLVHPRLGVTISKRTSKKANIRNFIKRQIRESFRKNKHLLPPVDVVFIANSSAVALNRKELSMESCRLLRVISDTYNKKI